MGNFLNRLSFFADNNVGHGLVDVAVVRGFHLFITTLHGQIILGDLSPSAAIAALTCGGARLLLAPLLGEKK